MTHLSIILFQKNARGEPAVALSFHKMVTARMMRQRGTRRL
jgi:hypothetical protein